MTLKNIPHCPGVNPGDVWAVAAAQTPHVLARRYDVRTTQMRAWLSGDEPMPRMLYELLAFRVRCVLPSTAGLWAGWTVEGGERLNGPGIEHRGGIHWSDVYNLPEYRRANRLAERQAELIERLMKENRFYRRQCELESRHAGLLRLMIDGPPKRL
ncbi:hypothetical protein [Chitinimonas koreensis]|uniref:hypothetical protein n=1 Tax=Chitinimonas koreensis TaxID=356302 RepID=UPI0012F7281F|nr:hypothetical protein [Chitinimonas koreensis]QNM98674.1 hypothetical protein H9L41_10890 [Chitinimonas koreensis]